MMYPFIEFTRLGNAGVQRGSKSRREHCNNGLQTRKELSLELRREEGTPESGPLCGAKENQIYCCRILRSESQEHLRPLWHHDHLLYHLNTVNQCLKLDSEEWMLIEPLNTIILD